MYVGEDNQQIVYDNAAIEALLDRNREDIVTDRPDTSQLLANDYLSSFKVRKMYLSVCMCSFVGTCIERALSTHVRVNVLVIFLIIGCQLCHERYFTGKYECWYTMPIVFNTCVITILHFPRF